MENWNKDNLGCDLTEEFKYMNEIDKEEVKIDKLKIMIRNISFNEHSCIMNNKQKIKLYLSYIDNKLDELYNIIMSMMIESKNKRYEK